MQFLRYFPGGDSEGATPVPIPSTAVEAFRGDGTATSPGWRVAWCQELFYSYAVLLDNPVSHWTSHTASSMAKHSAVNRRIAGSSPARGAIFLCRKRKGSWEVEPLRALYVFTCAYS